MKMLSLLRGQIDLCCSHQAVLPGDAVLSDGREEERVDNTERGGEKIIAFYNRCFPFLQTLHF